MKEAAARVADAIGADILPEHLGTGGVEAAAGPDGGRPGRRHWAPVRPRRQRRALAVDTKVLKGDGLEAPSAVPICAVSLGISTVICGAATWRRRRPSSRAVPPGAGETR